MNREEAIQIIKDRNFYCIECIDRSEKCCKALNMAIEALEKEIGCEYCKFDDVDGKFDSLCMNCYSHDMWVRKENKQ